MKSAYTRSIFYTAVRFHPTRESIVSHRDEEIHSKVRAQMTSGVCTFRPYCHIS